MIQTSISTITYVGNGSTTTAYPIPFLFFENEHIYTTAKDANGAETIFVIGTDFTLTGAGNPNGGSLKTIAPLPATSTLTIFRTVPYTQQLAYEEGDAFPAKSHEKGLDLGTMCDQQLARGMGDGSGNSDTDIGSAFRVTDASGGFPSVNKKTDTALGVDTEGDAILRTPTEMLSWLGQVGTVWANDAQRAQTRGAFAGQTGVQIDNWTIYVARSTEPGDWVPHLKESGVVISTNGTPTAKMNPDGDIVGTTHAQILTNKTLNACAIHSPTGLTAADVGLGNVDNTGDEEAPVSIPMQLALEQKQDIAVKGFAQGYASLDDGGKVPIEQLPATVTGGNASFQTSWNAATNTPTIPPALPENNGFYYLVAVAGTTTIDGISSWAVGDQIISDGVAWKKITSTATVSSVAGKIGAVTLNKNDVGLNNVDNTSDTTKNAATAALTNHTIKGSQNTLEVRLDADVINNLPTSRLNGGTGAGPNTWWCGDNTWKQPQGTGDVTGATTSVVGEPVVFADTDGKHIKGYSGPAGFAIFTPGNATTAKSKIQMADIDAADFHAMEEKTATVEDDEFVLWDSVTGQLQKVKKKNLGVPVATIVDWAGRPGNQPDNVAVPCPEGWLICNGKQYPKETYPALFDVLGYGYGGSGANFAVPDICGRATVSRDYSEATGGDKGRLSIHGASRYTIGGAFGAQSHTLDYNQMPSHQHGTFILGYHNAVVNGNYGLASLNCGIPCGVGFAGSIFIYDGVARGNYIRYDAAGGNATHNNTQPTFVVWKIIKY